MQRKFHKLRISPIEHAELLTEGKFYDAAKVRTGFANLVRPDDILAVQTVMEDDTGMAVLRNMTTYRAGANTISDSSGNIIATSYGIACLSHTGDTITVEKAFLTNADMTEGWLLAGNTFDGKFPDIVLVIHILEQIGVRFMVGRDELKARLEEAAGAQKWICVAQSTPPVHGSAARTEILVDMAGNKKKRNASGAIDYREQSKIIMVSRGQPILRRIPEIPSIPGMDIFGKTIPGIVEKHTAINPGKNLTEDSARPGIYTAAIDGLVSLTPTTISVNDVLAIDGDVNMSTGNIRFNGTVRVSGSVRAGMRIESDGDVIVEGLSEFANIVSKGSIIVKGGIIGKGKSLIKAEGNVLAGFTQNANVSAQGDIFIDQSVMNSLLCSGDSIYITGDPGTVKSGVIVARRRIEANDIGSDFQQFMALRTGVGVELQQRRKSITDAMLALKTQNSDILQHLRVFHGISKMEELPGLFRSFPQEKKIEVAAAVKDIQKNNKEIKFRFSL